MEVELLYKRIEGTLTPEESVEVERWLMASPLHMEYLKRLERHYSDDGVSELPDNLLASFRISFEEKVAMRFRNRRRKWIVAGMLAACVTFLGGVVIWNYSNDEPKKTVLPEYTELQDHAGQPETSTDTLQYYKEKKSNGKVFLSLSNSSTYSIDEIPVSCRDYVDYDEDCGVLTYSCPDDVKVVEMQKIRTAPGADLCVITEDGTKIWLNSDTELEFPNVFDKEVRRVNIKGEAYFEVNKDSSRPFIVDADNMAIRVYGTQFNVNTRKQGMITTTLVEGSVTIQAEGDDAETFLKPGETGEYLSSSNTIEINNNDIDLYIGWRNGSYHFRDTHLKDLFDEVSHWYGIEVAFEDDKVSDESFSGIISRNMPLVDLLNLLSQTNYITFELSGNRVIISEKEYN